MATNAEIIHQLLIDLGLTEESNTWPSYISFLPDMPADAIGIYDTAGIVDGRIMTGERIEHGGVMVHVRSDIYPVGWDKAQAIASALDNQIKTIVAVESDAIYVVHNVSRKGTINALGLDGKDGQRRHYFTINMALTVAVQV